MHLHYQQELAHAITIAKDAALQAGAFLKMKLGDAIVVAEKDDNNYQFSVDLQAENIILAHLRYHTPSYSFLTEEMGEEIHESNYQWIIDPLDGSSNYFHKLPYYAVSIGLKIAQVMCLAVIYLPAFDELFVAVKDGGATLNGHVIYTSKVARVHNAFVHFGVFTKGSDGLSERLTYMKRLDGWVERMRILGAAAADFAYVACGKADAFLLQEMQSWDSEIGPLLVIEAGGRISSINTPGGKSLIIASNALIHDHLLALLD